MLTLTLLGAGIGLGVGAIWDALVQRRLVIFRAAPTTTIAPILEERRQGVTVTLRF